MKNTNKRLFALFTCLVLVVCALLALTSCGECTEHKFGEWETTVAATCTTEGKRVRTCQNDKCEEKEEETILALGHDYETTVTTPATCQADGVKTTTCKREGCTYSATEAIGKLNHVPDREEATCEAAKTCTVCHTVLEEKKTHAYVETVVDPTCTAGGYTKVTCANCDYENTKNRVPALNHTPGAVATCESDQVCTRCNAVLTPKKPHNYTVFEESHVATCDAEGYEIRKCETCELTIRETTAPALGHDVAGWTETSRALKEGTDCTYVLTYTGECARCGEQTKTEEKDIHSFDAKVTTPATCQTAGKKTLTCTKCHADGGTVSYEDTNAHAWGTPTAGEREGYLVSACAHCDTKKELLDASDKVEADIPADASSVKMKEAELELDDTVKGLLGEGTKLTADTLDDVNRNNLLEGLTEEEKEKIGDSKIYNFGLESNGGQISQFEGGKITITIPYTLAEEEDPESIAIYYVTSEREIRAYKATYANGYATFAAEHFSYYTVARLTPAERCAVYGHTNIVGDVPVTCTTEGYHYELCRRCGHLERSNIFSPPGHNMTETTTPATCTTDGKVVYTCQNEGCIFQYTNVIPATGHDFAQDDATSKAASCTEAGLAHFVCSHEDCDAEYSVTLPVIEHTIVVKTISATCTTDGYTLNTCSVCGLTYRTGERVAFGHNMAETLVPATCTEDGYTLHACRSCDYSYKTDTVAKHHTFDLDAPTCGQGQTCTVCGAAGLPATGAHTMVDGVCSVCGQGCNHDFTTTTKAPTCTDGGYDEKTCLTCGKVVRENYTKKLGHDYKNGACTRCGDKLDLSNLYYQINRSLMTTKYAFLVKNVKLVIVDTSIFGGSGSDTGYAFFLAEDEEPTTEVDPDVTITVSGEFYFAFDEDGELYGYIIGNMTGTVNKSDGDASAVAMIRDGKIYFKTELKKPEQQKYTGVVNFDVAKDMGVQGGNSMIWSVFVSYIPEVMDWYERDVLPLLLSISDAKADEIAARTEELLSLFFKMEDREEGSYTFSFDFDKLHTLNDMLAEKTLGELFDLVFGEGAYDSILTGLIPGAFNLTLGDLFDAMEEEGMSVNTILDLVDTLLARLQIKIVADETITITSIDSLLASFGITMDIRAMLANEEIRAMKIADIVKMFLPADIAGILEADTIVNMVKDTVNNLKGQTIYTIIASLTALPDDSGELTEEEIAQIVEEKAAEYKDMVDGVIEMLRSFISLSFRTDATGAVEDIALKVNAEINGIGSLLADIAVVRDYTSDFDFDAAFADIDDIVLNPHSADGEDAFELVFDEDGNLVAIKKIEKRIHSFELDSLKDQLVANRQDDPETGDYTYILPETFTIHTRGAYETTTYRMKDLLAMAVTRDCGDWRSVEAEFLNVEAASAEATFDFTFSTSEALSLFGLGAGDAMGLLEALYAQPPADYQGLGAMYLVYSGSLPYEEKVTLAEHAVTQVSALDGLSFCYNVTTDAMSAESSMHDIEETYRFATEVEDCKAGVICERKCKNCQKVTNRYTSYGHIEYTRETVYPTKNANCAMWSVTYTNCFCGKYGDVEIDGHEFYETPIEPTMADGVNVKIWKYRCMDPDCTFIVRKRLSTTENGCEQTQRYTWTVMEDGATVKEWYFERVETVHTQERTTYTLVPGATSCEDGVVIAHWCDGCGWHDEDRTVRNHREYTKETYDLAKYGSKCGGTLSVQACACGRDRCYKLETKCASNGDSHAICSQMITGNCTRAECYICPVTDCAFRILFKQYREVDTSTCSYVTKRYAYLGWDGTTLNPEGGIYVEKYEGTEHTMGEATETTGDDGHCIVTSVCKYCEYTHIDEYWYKSEEDRARDDFWKRVSTTKYDRKTARDNNSIVREVWQNFDEDDPRREFLRLEWYYYRHETTDWYGNVRFDECGYEFNEGTCEFRYFVRYSNGGEGGKSWESLHDYADDARFSILFELVADEEPTSCTKSGIFAVQCKLCGKRVDPFTRGVFQYQGESGGMESDVFVPVWSMYFSTGSSPWYVSPSSYDKETGTFKMAYGHSYEWDDGLGMCVCSSCGLKNKTGQDAVAILEDLTTDEDKTAGIFRVGYLRLTTARLMPQLSLVLRYNDDEGNTVEEIVYFDGEYAKYWKEALKPEDYVTFDDSTLTVKAAELIEFIQKNKTSEFELVADDQQVLLRLNIVPEGGWQSLECAITFE